MYNVTNDSGEESYWSFAHDISERIRYEAQIKRLNQIMDTTINNLPATGKAYFLASKSFFKPW